MEEFLKRGKRVGNLIYLYGILWLLSLGILLWGRFHYGDKTKGIGYGGGMFIYRMVRRYDKSSIEAMRQYRKIQVATKAELAKRVEDSRIRLIGMSLCVFMGLQLIGFLICISHSRSRPASVIQLQRDDYDGEEQNYVLNAILEDGTTESLQANISPKQYSQKEIDVLFEDGFKRAWKEVLGENASFERVTKPLNFITRIEGNPLMVNWWWEDEAYICEDGQLNYDMLQEKKETILYLELRYNDDIRQQSVPIILQQPIYTKQQLVLQKLQSRIALYNQQNQQEDMVTIPAELCGVELEYGETSGFDWYFLILAVLIPGILWMKNHQNLQQTLVKRQQQLAYSYSELINKLVLYLGAGMTIKHCFIEIYQEYQKSRKPGQVNYLYEEIGVMVQELHAGVSELRCYEEWGNQLEEASYIKLANLLTQNLSKGSEGILLLLRQEMQQAQRERRELARKCGEEAGTKLLFPMLLLLLTVMIVVIIPAFLQFGIG